MQRDTLNRRKRFHKLPGKTKHTGERRQLEITARDVAVFKILARYRYLPIDFIWRLLPADIRGTCYKRFQERMGELHHQDYLNRPRAQRRSENAKSRPLIYELGSQGKAECRARGIEIYPRLSDRQQFPHDLMACMVMAYIEIACAETQGLQLVTWEDILEHPATPEVLRASKHPLSIPKIPIRLNGTSVSAKRDSRPFGIRGYGDGGNHYAFCSTGIEADCSNEPLRPSDITARANIEAKLRGYLYIEEEKVYQTHFGFPNNLDFFITTSKRRMRNIMQLFSDLTGGKGADHVLFAYLPNMNSVETAPEPNAEFFLQNFERVGHPPFNIINELHAALQKGAA